MNQLMFPVLTMSSRDIAELTGKRHDNVMTVIRDLIEAQILTSEIQELDYIHRGNTYKHFLLNKRDSLILVARLSPEFTAQIVDRWQEFSIYDIDFKPIPTVDQHPPALSGMGYFGVVQYIGAGRSADWLTYY